MWQNLRNRENQLYDMLIFNSYIFESIAENEVLQLLNTSKTTAYRILSQLDNWLEIQGTTGKGTHYTLKGFTKGS